MMGDTRSTRDRIAAAHVLTSLYVMEFAPGGTNFPHHHETEEEIYVLLNGRGEMVAGGGMKPNEQLICFARLSVAMRLKTLAMLLPS